jgi:glutamate-1-semialdehyde 2,1-aminomutase
MRPGSAQLYFGVTPDLTTAAKAIGGGFSIAALLGKTEIMNHLSPLGKSVMSGTYSGALMPVLASLECLTMAGEPGFYDHIDAIGEKLYGGINDLFNKHGMKGHARGVGARFGIYFGVENPETDYDFRKVAQEMDRAMTKKFIAECYPHGLWFHDTAGPVSPAHYGFTVQHTLADIDIALERIDQIFAKIK